jgi:predicted transcriptional regulator
VFNNLDTYIFIESKEKPKICPGILGGLRGRRTESFTTFQTSAEENEGGTSSESEPKTRYEQYAEYIREEAAKQRSLLQDILQRYKPSKIDEVEEGSNSQYGDVLTYAK